MTIHELKEITYETNLELVKRNLVIYTWGNVSAIDRESGLIAIKPRGIEYSDLEVEDIPIVDLDGKTVEGRLLPSVDLDIHLELYRNFDTIGGIAHTHSEYATSFCQSLRSIKVSGTTHADHFKGAIPCLDYLPEKDVMGDYERNLGRQIVSYFKEYEISPVEMGAVLAGGHGPFTWGKNAFEAVEHSVILEELAKMAYRTYVLSGKEMVIPDYMQNKHYERKYGSNAYFYQTK